MPDTCSASWPGGQCDRDPWQTGLCGGHYNQKRRHPDRPFRPLKGAHGADPRGLVPVGFMALQDDVDTVRAAAEARQVPESELYREALDAYAKKLRKKGSAG